MLLLLGLQVTFSSCLLAVLKMESAPGTPAESKPQLGNISAVFDVTRGVP
jgi:hypothetical protein